MSFQDDGAGFDETEKREGFGLQGMKERVENMGGRLTIQSVKGTGTEILISLPIPAITGQED